MMVDGLIQRDNQGNNTLPLIQAVKLNTLMYALGRENVERVVAAANPENRTRLTSLAQHLIEYEKMEANIAHTDLIKQIATGKFPTPRSSANRPPVERIRRAGRGRNPGRHP
jgi:hypothetical protein